MTVVTQKQPQKPNYTKPSQKKGATKRSKFAKSKGIGNQPVPGTPIFIYTSVCCGEIATKPTCARHPDDKAEGKKSESSLGSWTCPKCRKRAKVNRSKNKEGLKVSVPIKKGSNA